MRIGPKYAKVPARRRCRLLPGFTSHLLRARRRRVQLLLHSHEHAVKIEFV